MTYVALVGLTLILVRGTIFAPLQRRWELLRCSMCCGWWVGALAGASGVAAMGHGRALDALLVGGATSCLSLATDATLVKLLGEPD